MFATAIVSSFSILHDVMEVEIDDSNQAQQSEIYRKAVQPQRALSVASQFAHTSAWSHSRMAVSDVQTKPQYLLRAMIWRGAARRSLSIFRCSTPPEHRFAFGVIVVLHFIAGLQPDDESDEYGVAYNLVLQSFHVAVLPAPGIFCFRGCIGRLSSVSMTSSSGQDNQPVEGFEAYLQRNIAVKALHLSPAICIHLVISSLVSDDPPDFSDLTTRSF